MAGHDKPELIQQLQDHKSAARKWVRSLSAKRQKELRRASQALAAAVHSGDAELMSQMADGDLNVDRLLAAGNEEARWFGHIVGFSNVWQRMQLSHQEGFRKLKETIDRGMMTTALAETEPQVVLTNFPPELDRELTTAFRLRGAEMLAAQLDITRERTSDLIQDVFDTPPTQTQSSTTTFAARVIGGLLLLVWFFFLLPGQRRAMQMQGGLMKTTVFQLNLLPFLLGLGLVVTGQLWLILGAVVAFVASVGSPATTTGFCVITLPMVAGGYYGHHLATHLGGETVAWHIGGIVGGLVVMFGMMSVIVALVSTLNRKERGPG
jgi:hypothetical protein